MAAESPGRSDQPADSPPPPQARGQAGTSDETSFAETRGRLIKWNDGKGYGFVQPDDGSADVFAHISAFAEGQRRPKEGDAVFFRIDHGGRRPKASSVRLDVIPLPDTTWLAYGVAAMCLTVFFLFVLGIIGLSGPILAYMVMSILTYGFYFADKRRAERSEWRLTETTLHVLEALGGWPGALLAQAGLRHKTRKMEYQVILWAIIAVHIGAWSIWYLRRSLA
ncbi:MAG TPA: cold shock and DUF1294 domain-containing protein [Candidatus Binatia bacterium]|nr:cold shock and DUF1294 domain-containing protein [Candidatus Binatia bacterium]